MRQIGKDILHGLHVGFPIALGYFAVAFSLGIIAAKAGLTAPEGFLSSFFIRASAGEYGVYTLVAVQAAYVEVVAMCLVANLRYMLMSAALSQKIAPGTSWWHRVLMACCITDEIFGITIAKQGYIEPTYSFGALIVSAPLWALGTALGITVGNILPAQIVSALSVALFGMFLAVIIPAARHDRIVALVVVCSFAASLASGYAPWIKTLSAGNRTILLTLILSSAAAILFPIKDTFRTKEGDADEH